MTAARDYSQSLFELRHLVQQLPTANRKALEYFVRHMIIVAHHSQFNKMTVKNLALAVGLTLFPEILSQPTEKSNKLPGILSKSNNADEMAKALNATKEANAVVVKIFEDLCNSFEFVFATDLSASFEAVTRPVGMVSRTPSIASFAREFKDLPKLPKISFEQDLVFSDDLNTLECALWQASLNDSPKSAAKP